MKSSRLLWSCLLFWCAAHLTGCESAPPRSQQTVATPQEEYRLAAGDVVSIRIYGGEEDISYPRIRLNQGGQITLPFAQITAAGRTTQELETTITESAKGKYLMKPRVWVNIEEYRPYFMQGQIGRPGAYPYQPGLNVRRAINIAGGFRDRAAKGKIFLLPENTTTSKPTRVELETPVRPGDTVIVEESFF